MRAALGAGRGRLAREMLVESLTLSVVGGAVGIALAVGAVKLVVAMSPARLPRLEQMAVDGTSLVFTLALSLVAGLPSAPSRCSSRAAVPSPGRCGAGGATPVPGASATSPATR